MSRVITGLEKISSQPELTNNYKGNVALLCHSASVTPEYELAVEVFIRVFGERFTKIFGPQHGLVSDVQDNMIETDHYTHPYFKRPVYSLYSETRVPTDEMLKDIDVFFIDLQDVGTRVYTYISTMGLLMERCQELGIKVVVLDRPNPVGGEIIEGNVLEEDFKSFVGHYKIPQRHAMTMGEVANFAKKYQSPKCDLEVIKMDNWNRSMFFKDTNLPWVNPSPNLPTMDGAITFAGTVLYEGTNVSEGRGTTRALEVIGHPSIEPFSFTKKLNQEFSKTDLEGFILRPLVFMPTFHKHASKPCGGVHIHVSDASKFKSWAVSQIICKALFHELGDSFEWVKKPYEYEFEKLAIDLINGSDKVRKWIESNGSYTELQNIEAEQMDDYLSKRSECLLY